MVDLLRLQQASGQLPQEGKNAADLLSLESQTTAIEANQNDIAVWQGIDFGLQVDQKLQREVVILEIEQSGNDLIVIRCRNREGKLGEQLDTQPTEAPKISFDQSIANKTFPQMFGSMRRFSQEFEEAIKIRGWLIELRDKLEKKYQQKISYVIINDHTDYEIPWELLELRKKEFLGISFVVTRWQDMKDSYSFDPAKPNVQLDFCNINCSGEIVAYLNTKDLESVKTEKDMILGKFKPREIYHDVQEFFDCLDGIEEQVGLVFLASHGFFGRSLSDSKLGGDSNSEQISLDDLYEYDFEFLEESSSLFFINTCHSARLQVNDALKISKQPTGFATFFLKRGAAGVIGTLCEVPDMYAAQISHDFFEEWEKEPDKTVPEILTQLRRNAFQQYQECRSDKNKKYLFLITFMYVYYGNPMARLNIKKRGEK